jgi:glucose/arabinose dehydrogenase
MRSKLLALGFLPILLSPLSAQGITRELVASGLSAPLWAGSPPGDYDRIFVCEQSTGRVRIIRNGAILPTPYLTVTVGTGSERGLLGAAFHPNYAQNGYFYVSFTRQSDGASMVVRYRVSAGNRDIADPTTATTMIGPIAQPFSNHNGGCILFGRDGRLYFGLGDGGSAGDPSCNAQNGQSLLGKMLRVDVDTNPNGPAIAAAGNPFLGSATFRSEIWSYGWRNPWRFSFDRETGDMWVGDVGQNALEEIDFQPAASTGGENYGWKIKEGTNCFSTSACTNPAPCASTTLVNPVRTLPTSSNCAVIGGYVYRGCAIPSLRGTYFYGDNCSGRIYSFEYVNGTVTNARDRTAEVGGGSGLTSFGEDQNGEILYCLSGSLYRIVPTGLLNSRVAGPGSVGSNGKTPIYEICGRFGTGNTLTFRVRDGLPNAATAVLFGTQATPFQLPFPGFGYVVPLPILFSVPMMTDGDGVASFSLPSGGPVVNVFHQCAILDMPLGGVTLSNALETFWNAGPAPTISSVAPLSAAAGGTVTVTGTNYDPAVTLTVAGNPVALTSASSTRLTFLYPAGTPCDSTVVVRNPDNQSASVPFNPNPRVTSLIPNTGPAAGGTQLIIVGTGFSTGTTVMIGGAAAAVTSVSSSAIVCTTPPGSPGAAQIDIATPGGCTTMSTFNYQ